MSSVQQNVIKHKVGLLTLAAEFGNVSRDYKVMGFSRDTFTSYRYLAAVETGGVEALAITAAVAQGQSAAVLCRTGDGLDPYPDGSRHGVLRQAGTA